MGSNGILSSRRVRRIQRSELCRASAICACSLSGAAPVGVTIEFYQESLARARENIPVIDGVGCVRWGRARRNPRDSISVYFSTRLFLTVFSGRIWTPSSRPAPPPSPHRAEPSTDRFPLSVFRPWAFREENRPAVAAHERRYETVSRYTDNPDKLREFGSSFLNFNSTCAPVNPMLHRNARAQPRSNICRFGWSFQLNCLLSAGAIDVRSWCFVVISI